MKKMSFKVGMLALAGIGMCSLLSGCQSKQALTAEDFKSKMEEKGYDLQDCTDQFEGYDFVEQVYVALDDEGSYQIEFYDLSDDAHARDFFSNNVQIFKESKSNMSANTNVSLGNYEKYTQTDSDQFSMISRIDDTVIYVVEEKENKEAVEAVVKELGY